LRLNVAGHKRWSRITTLAALPAPAAPVATVTAGEAIGYTVTNTGSGPMLDTGRFALTT
jgi:hypothetical protein